MKMSTHRRLSIKQLVPQHCKDDLACLHCCSCWLIYKKQYEIKFMALTSKYEQAKKQIQFLSKMNKQLTNQLNLCKAKLRKVGNIEMIKQQFRKQIYEEIKKEREVQDAIMKQKIQILTEQLQTTRNQLSDLQNRYIKVNDKLKQVQIQLEEAKHDKHQLEQQNVELKKQNQQLNQKMIELYDTIKSYEQRVDEKQDVIEQLRLTINDLEGRFMIQKAKASSMGADKDLLQMNLKNRDKYIQSLTKCSQQNLKNLNNLEYKNAELKKIVNDLDCEVEVGRYNENYFRDRLMSSQHQLILTEGLARYNSEKVQMMKNDLHLLKLTI